MTNAAYHRSSLTGRFGSPSVGRAFIHGAGREDREGPGGIPVSEQRSRRATTMALNIRSFCT